MLIVDLTDSSGINDAGSGVGHGLDAWLDGDPKSIDLTDFYTGAKNNYQAGTIEYQFTGLAPGQHTLAVRAWDVYNNSSTSQVAFSVASAHRLHWKMSSIFRILFAQQQHLLFSIIN